MRFWCVFFGTVENGWNVGTCVFFLVEIFHASTFEVKPLEFTFVQGCN